MTAASGGADRSNSSHVCAIRLEEERFCPRSGLDLIGEKELAKCKAQSRRPGSRLERTSQSTADRCSRSMRAMVDFLPRIPSSAIKLASLDSELVEQLTPCVPSREGADVQ